MHFLFSKWLLTCVDRVATSCSEEADFITSAERRQQHDVHGVNRCLLWLSQDAAAATDWGAGETLSDWVWEFPSQLALPTQVSTEPLIVLVFHAATARPVGRCRHYVFNPSVCACMHTYMHLFMPSGGILWPACHRLLVFAWIALHSWGAHVVSMTVQVKREFWKLIFRHGRTSMTNCHQHFE